MPLIANYLTQRDVINMALTSKGSLGHIRASRAYKAANAEKVYYNHGEYVTEFIRRRGTIFMNMFDFLKSKGMKAASIMRALPNAKNMGVGLTSPKGVEYYVLSIEFNGAYGKIYVILPSTLKSFHLTAIINEAQRLQRIYGY